MHPRDATCAVAAGQRRPSGAWRCPRATPRPRRSTTSRSRLRVGRDGSSPSRRLASSADRRRRSARRRRAVGVLGVLGRLGVVGCRAGVDAMSRAPRSGARRRSAAAPRRRPRPAARRARRRPGRASGSPGSTSPATASSAGASSAGIGSTSTMPGHGLTMRASSGKSLRSGKPSNSVGRYMLRRSGWPAKRDAEHLVGLPLVPVGAGVDGEPRLDGQRVVGDVDLQRHADVALDVGHPGEQLEPGVAAGRRPGGPRCCARAAARSGRPRRGRTATASSRSPTGSRSTRSPSRPAPRRPAFHASVAMRTHRSSFGLQLGVDERVADAPAQLVDDALAQAVTGQRLRLGRRSSSRRHSMGPPPTTIGSRSGMTSCPSPRHLAAMSSLRIFCCSRTMPSSSASGRGGQPGT